MYISRLIFNPRHRRTQAELANPYELHRSLLAGFPASLPQWERILFRVETGQAGHQITCLVQSMTKPDWDSLTAQAGYLEAVEGPKEFSMSLATGQKLAFRLRANPVIAKSDGTPGKRGQRVGLLKEEEQYQWLERKLDAVGARLLEARIANQGHQRSRKRPGSPTLSHLAVQFEGILTVVEPAGLLQGVKEGIGPAKGFGFGLLSLARV